MTDPKQFDTATTWAIENELRDRRAGRIAWVVASIAAAIALLEAVAIVLLLPLQKLETIALLVDRNTGFIQTIHPGDGTEIRADEALLKSYLAQYVTAREGFDRNTVTADYRKTALWSGGAARGRYLAYMNSSNASSPFNRYRAGDEVQIDVKSVSLMSDDVALIRFDTVLVARDGRSNDLGSWIATARFQFSNAGMSFEDRLLNPLGFQVVSYRTDAEKPGQSSKAYELDDTQANALLPRKGNMGADR